MSVLSGLSRRTTLQLTSATLASPISALNAFPVLQTRSKAGAVTKKKPTPGQAQGRRKNVLSTKKDGGESGRGTAKKETKLGAFMPMGASSLTHPTFQSDNRAVLDLPKFGPTTLSRGAALAFDAPENDPMRKFGLPKSMLVEFRLLSKPCSVIRDATMSTVKILDNAANESSDKTRTVLTGQAGCGKSFLLLQAVEYCISQGWVVIYVPRAINLINSSVPYSYDARTRVYAQPTFAYQTLERIRTVNGAALKGLKTSQPISVERQGVIAPGTQLLDLIAIGTKDQTLAPTVLEAVLSELGAQQSRPVLLAIDDFQALYNESTYRDPLFARIKSYHLSMPRLLLEYASGQRSFARGAVLGALSSQNTYFKAPVELREALNLPHDRPTGPYVKREQALKDYAKGLKNLPVPDKLSVDEAASLFEVWMKDRALYGVSESAGTVADEVFLAKYTESSGNARNFVRNGLLSSLAYA